jgi:hypothetical protein
MAAALQGLANGPVSKQHQAMFGILRQLPEAVHDELRTRIGSVKLDDVAIAEAQQRIAQQARSLRKKGLIGKPGAQASPTDVSDLPHTDSQPHLPAGLRADLRVWDQPLDCLSIEQLRTGLGALAVAHEAGMLEATIPEGGTGCLWHGIRLTVDSVEPPLIEDIVETYAGTALRQLRLRMRLTMEAILAIAHSDNPRILPLKLAPIYTVAPDTRYRQVEGTVELALQRLERTPATLMSLDELTELFTDFAWIARRSHALRGDDFLGLTEVAVAVDDEFIACGLDLLIKQGRSQRQMDDGYRGVINDMRSSLQTQSDQCLLEAGQRYRMLTAGIVAIAAGRGQQIQAALDRL